MYRSRTLRVVLTILLMLLACIGVLGWLSYRAVQQARMDHRLIAAVRQSNVKAAQLLLAAGADPDTRDIDATRQTLVVRLRQAINRLRGRKNSLSRNPTALILASENGDIKMLEALFTAHADANLKDQMGRTALICAAYQNRPLAIPILIQHHADINAADNYGRTALMGAAVCDYTDAVRLLLAHGADPNARTTFNRTALMWAAGFQYKATIDILLEHNPDVNIRDKEGKSALMYALGNGASNIPPFSYNVNKIVVTTNKVNSGKAGAVFVSPPATHHIVEALIRHGADVNTRDQKGKTALQQAQYLKFDDLIKTLKQAGAKSKL